MRKMSIQYMVLGFKPSTSWTWVSCDNHLTRAPALVWLSYHRYSPPECKWFDLFIDEPPSIQRWDLNSWTLAYESPLITTRPGLCLPKLFCKINLLVCTYIFHSNHLSLHILSIAQHFLPSAIIVLNLLWRKTGNLIFPLQLKQQN